MRLRFRHLALLTSVGLAGASAACSSDSSNVATVGIGSGEYKGELSGKNETGILDVVLSGASLTPNALRPLDTQDQATAVGTVTLGGGISLQVTGTFDPDTGVLALSGSGYSFTGNAASDGINGSYSGPNGGGSFTLIKGGGAQIFCGSFAGPDHGVWNLVVGPTSAAGSVASASGGYASPMACTVNGASLSCTASGGVTASGSVSGTTVSGTWSSGNGRSGTWTGDTGSCPVPQAKDAGPGSTVPDAASGVDAASGNDSGPDATFADAGGDAAGGSDSSAQDAATTNDASGGGDSGAPDASSVDAGLVCSTPACKVTGGTCVCERTDSVSSYAMQCTQANACYCTVDGVQSSSVFTGPFTSCTGAGGTGGAYTMAKYCGCPAAEPDAGSTTDASASDGGPADAGTSSSDASTSDAGTSSSDASTSDASANDGGFNCTLPSLAGVPALTVNAHLSTPFPASAAAGGTPISGTYYDTTVDVYQGGSTPAHTHEVIIIDTTAGELREIDDGGASDRLVATYVTAGSTITLTAVCGGTGTLAFGYTGTATQIVVYDAQNNRVETFTRQ